MEINNILKKSKKYTRHRKYLLPQ